MSGRFGGKVAIVTGGGIAHTGMPDFAPILDGVSYLDGAETLVKR